MSIHFGIVKDYLPQKGFGFVINPLDSNVRKEVFFHISKVQRFSKDLANKLSTYKASNDIYFYYEAENTPKGKQIKCILPSNNIRNLLGLTLPNLTQKLISIWQDIGASQPIWLCDVTQDLIGTNELNKLKIEREFLKEKKKEEEELKQKEQERILTETLKNLKLFQEQQRVENEEFELLVAEIESKNFVMSWQVSNYIVTNRLGDKYKHISGVLEMEINGSSWKFNGGFPPKIYSMLCQRIGLGNKGTNSRVVGFTAFKDL